MVVGDAVGKQISVESLLSARSDKIGRLRTQSDDARKLHEAISGIRKLRESVEAIDEILAESGHDVSGLEQIPVLSIVRSV